MSLVIRRDLWCFTPQGLNSSKKINRWVSWNSYGHGTGFIFYFNDFPSHSASGFMFPFSGELRLLYNIPVCCINILKKVDYMNFYAYFQCFWSPEGWYQAAGALHLCCSAYDSLLSQAWFLHFPQDSKTKKESAGDAGANSSCEVEPHTSWHSVGDFLVSHPVLMLWRRDERREAGMWSRVSIPEGWLVTLGNAHMPGDDDHSRCRHDLTLYCLQVKLIITE